ncbi:MAG TPA: hypothetical protein VHQ90_21320 [Thermoanaerobaculia bacterium]|nr:hypothetical protein [Thermoanaerobaculia bacterium]
MKTIAPLPALRLILAAAAIGLGPTAAAAAPGELAWTRWGPGQGQVRAMALDPAGGLDSICFAPVFGGVFCSGDGGATVQPQNQGLDGDNVVALAADPARGRLLAVAAGGTLYWRRRGDWQPLYDGSAWASVTAGLPRHWVRLVLGPLRFYLAAGSAVFRSDDAGESWVRVLTAQAEISGLVLDPASPDTLYVSSEPGLFGEPGSGVGGLLKSTDGGASWTSLQPASWTSPPPDQRFPQGIASLAVAAASPQAPAAIYAATDTPALFRSRDGGASWVELASGHIPGENWLVTALAIDPASPATVIASRLDGTYVSFDGGDSWRPFNQQDLSLDVLSLQAGPGARPLYAATPFGVYASAGNGGQWTAIYGFFGNGGALVRFHPADPAKVYAVVSGAISVSGDGGVSWSGIGKGGIDDLAFAPPTPHRAAVALYAAAPDVQRSDDGGATWKGLPLSFAQVVAPLRQRTVLAGGYGASLSLDGGETWAETLSSSDGRDLEDFARKVTALRVDPADSRRVYARVVEYTHNVPADKRLFASLDSGASWSAIFEGSDAVAIDPRQPGALYVLAGTRLFKSNDSGASFVRVPTVGLAGFVANDLVVDPASPSVLYAAGIGGMRRSVNGGRIWTAANRGLERRAPSDPRGPIVATRLFFAPAVPHLLYVAANGVLYQAVFP